MTRTKLAICVFGLGEAGSLISADLAAAGVCVSGYDPKPVATPMGVTRFDDPVSAVQGADVVIALTAAVDAPTALEQAFDVIPDNALYADFSTASSDLKRRLGETCATRAIDFVDVAIMSIVPGHGVRAPTLVSGSGARRFVDIFQTFAMPTGVVSDNAGDAAARKLVRSVMMKGLAAVVIEAMQAAQVAGCSEWLWNNMCDELTGANETTLARLVRGTHAHALRRLHEMEASTELLKSLGTEPVMTAATTQSLRNLLQTWPVPGQEPSVEGKGLPEWWSLTESKSG